jgi:hypothetical protein
MGTLTTEFDLYTRGIRRIAEDEWVTDMNVTRDADGLLGMLVLTIGPDDPAETALVVTLIAENGIVEAQVRHYVDGVLVPVQTTRQGLASAFTVGRPT